MGALGDLFRLFRWSPRGPEDDMHRLAALLLIEIRLNRQADIAQLAPGGALPDELAADLRRAIDIYLRQTGAAEQAESIFLAEAVEALGRQHREALAALVREEFAKGPPPLQPS